MATLIQAFARYGPRLVRRPAVQFDELVEHLARVANVRPSIVGLVVAELADAVLHYARRGASLHVPGLGTFRPSIRGDGELRLHFRVAPSLQRAFADRNAFQGRIANRRRIGLTPEDYKALWDVEHPDRPLDIARLAGPSAASRRTATGAGTSRGEAGRAMSGAASQRRKGKDDAAASTPDQR